MFCIRQGELLISPANSLKSHQEWLGEQWLSLVRGFVDSTGLYFYKGARFTASQADANELRQHLPELQVRLKLPATHQVYAGMKTGKIGEKWVPRKKLGTIAKFLP
jgi:hypothetical protein